MRELTITPATVQQLPGPVEVENSCRAAAVIDAVTCDGTQLSRHVRVFRFVHAWRSNINLGQMDDGQGDLFAVVFGPSGALIRGVVKETFRANRDAARVLEDYVRHGDPKAPAGLRKYLDEHDVSGIRIPCTYILWSTMDGPWRAPDPLLQSAPLGTQVIKGLEVLTGDPEAYVEWARHYLGHELPLRSVRALFEQVPLNPDLTASLGAKRPFSDIAAEASAMGYPVS
jgi:hypothetical protein